MSKSVNYDMQCVAQLSISSFKSKMYIHLIICTLHLEPRASRGKWLQKNCRGPLNLMTQTERWYILPWTSSVRVAY